MKYSSLNNNSSPTSFMKAVIDGLAPDRGLYFPQEKVILSKDFIESIKNQNFLVYSYLLIPNSSNIFIWVSKS